MSTRIEPGDGDSNQTYNKKRMPLEGLYKNRAARVSPEGEFTNADRLWRKKFIQDQKLSEADGILAQIYENPDYRKARYNIFRRIWQYPGNVFETGLRNTFGMSLTTACFVRNGTTMIGKLLVLSWAVSYYFLYNANDWTKSGGWKYGFSRPPILPGDEGEELFVRSKPSDHAYRFKTFEDSPI